MTSTDKGFKKIKGAKGPRTFFAIICWLIIWQVGAGLVDNSIFLPGPLAVARALAGLASQASFYLSILFTLAKLALALVLAITLGLALALLAYMKPAFQDFIGVALSFMKSVPVACFVVLLLLWFEADQLSIVIALIMTLPLIAENVFTGLKETDPLLLKMADSFQMGWRKKLAYIYLPQSWPYFKRAVLTGSSISFKAGIAAEIMALPKKSIGEEIYFSKLYLKTDELFAWIVVIVILSLALQKLLERILDPC